MKQTAVEWLEKQLDILDAYKIKVKTIIEYAKEMEKQQIFESWDNGFDNGNYYGKYNENCEVTCGEQYYNETYKQK